MTDEQEGNIQTKEFTPTRRKRTRWYLVALSAAFLAVVGSFILGEFALRQGKPRGWTIYGYYHCSNDESIAVAPDGTVWVKSIGGSGVSHFDGQSWTPYDISRGGSADGRVCTIATAPDGAVWVTTSAGSRFCGQAVSRFDGQNWTTYIPHGGLTDNKVDDIAVSPDGTAWFSFLGGGISHFDGRTWTPYTSEDGLASNGVNEIAISSNGTVWFATDSGISRFDGQTWTTYTSQDGLASSGASDITIAPDGTVWAGSSRGISRFDGETWTIYVEEDSLAGNGVNEIAVAPDDVLWIGTGQSLSRFDGETWTTYTPTNSGLPDARMYTLVVDNKGRIWGETCGKGIFVFDERVSVPAHTLHTWIEIWSTTRVILGILALILLSLLLLIALGLTRWMIMLAAIGTFALICSISFAVLYNLLFRFFVSIGFYVDSGTLPFLGATVCAGPIALGLGTLSSWGVVRMLLKSRRKAQ